MTLTTTSADQAWSNDVLAIAERLAFLRSQGFTNGPEVAALHRRYNELIGVGR